MPASKILLRGHLSYSVGKQRTGTKLARSQIIIAGNSNETEYLQFIQDIFYSLFNVELSYEKDNRSDTVLLRAHSKGILKFLSEKCEIPLNRKTEIVNVPEIIKCSSKGIKCAFLRGLADTDFSVTFKNKTNKGHNYPVIKASFRSKRLVQDLEKLYREIGFKYCVIYNLKQDDKRFGPIFMNHIYLNGRKNIYRWIKNIGFSNYKFNRKVDKWLKDGVCPPGY
ncbi:hypothetical protein HYU06_05140 [Candidatus Woesearchaeota archaeon]|nr:hypothetical protein [Candidatus Woesearchaeota archaeon]